VILGAVGSCGNKNDIYFLVTILVVFSLSLLLLMCALLDVFKTNCTSRGMVIIRYDFIKVVFHSNGFHVYQHKFSQLSQDFLFHLTGGVLIMIASIVLVSATDPGSCRVMEKTGAAVSQLCSL